MRPIRRPAAFAAGLILVLVAACSREAEAPAASTPAAAPAPAAQPDVYAFRIGALEAWALRDGAIRAPNDNSTLAVGETPEATAEVLSAAGLSTETLDLSIQPLLVPMGERVVMFDAGAAGQMGTQNKLPASLRAAGFTPDQVTDILISHMHGDHVGGLLGADGALAFPNAVIRMSGEEWTALQADASMAALVAAITPKVEPFVAGGEVLPGVTAVDIDGHTPGHSGYQIASGAERLLYIGDTMHHSVISVQRPEWTIAFDVDAPTAEASRLAVLQRAATDDARIYAVHFPFPGLGHIQRRDDGFVWVPETPAAPAP